MSSRFALNFSAPTQLLPALAARLRTTRGLLLALLLAVFGLVGLSTLTPVSGRIHSPIGWLPSGGSGRRPRLPSEPIVNTILDPPVANNTQDDITPIHRFDEPNYALLTAKPPHEYGCDVPLDGPDAAPLAFIGIFSTAGSMRRRDIYREHILPLFPKDLFEIKFILGQDYQPRLHPADVLQQTKLGRASQVEAELHGDMVFLDIQDNIDLGKTYEYFKWAAHEWGGEGQVKGRPQFVIKADDDTILVMPNLVSLLKDLDCNDNIYFGTTAGAFEGWNPYFRGMAYGMSWPLVSWIGNAPITYEQRLKEEDARTGEWMRSVDQATDPVTWYDLGWLMGDWNQVSMSRDIVALHWLKKDEWVFDNLKRVEEAWLNAGAPFESDNGVARDTLLEKGRWMPRAALEMYLGNHWLIPQAWDVELDLLDEVATKKGYWGGRDLESERARQQQRIH